MRQKLLVKAVDDGPPAVLPPFAWGSHRSRLVDVVRSGHENVQLDQESLDRIVTWIDMNAPYYGSYATDYPENAFGRSPLDNRQIGRLREITGLMLGDNATELHASQISFTRPELSPALGGADGHQSSGVSRSAIDHPCRSRDLGPVFPARSAAQHTAPNRPQALGEVRVAACSGTAGPRSHPGGGRQ